MLETRFEIKPRTRTRWIHLNCIHPEFTQLKFTHSHSFDARHRVFTLQPGRALCSADYRA